MQADGAAEQDCVQRRRQWEAAVDQKGAVRTWSERAYLRVSAVRLTTYRCRGAPAEQLHDGESGN